MFRNLMFMLRHRLTYIPADVSYIKFSRISKQYFPATPSTVQLIQHDVQFDNAPLTKTERYKRISFLAPNNHHEMTLTFIEPDLPYYVIAFKPPPNVVFAPEQLYRSFVSTETKVEKRHILLNQGIDGDVVAILYKKHYETEGVVHKSSDLRGLKYALWVKEVISEIMGMVHVGALEAIGSPYFTLDRQLMPRKRCDLSA